MADAQAVQAPAAPKKPRQGRSPAFPFIPLEKALERAESLRVAEGGRPKHFSPWSAVARAWGIGEKTGTMKQSVAALGHFGLFEFQGSGEERAARLTDTALMILLDKQPTSPERDALIRQLALKPAIHAELWAKWKNELPSDVTFETYLVRDRGFSENGARDLIGEYKATIAYAKLSQPDAMVEEPEGDDAHKEPAKVGDLVNVEINGALQFKNPKLVEKVESLDGQDWVFLEEKRARSRWKRSKLSRLELARPRLGARW